MKENTVVREPVAIGRFYPQNADQLHEAVPEYLAEGAACVTENEISAPVCVMLPHAGYVYCGKVMGATLAGLTLPDLLVILCPNHTGRGQMFSVWPKGAWKMPFGMYPVDEDLVQELCRNRLFTQDYVAHVNEHSIEVLLPFLFYACGRKIPTIVPVCVGTQNPQYLRMAALELNRALAVCAEQGRSVGIVVSSDMNHYEDHETCMKKDALALAEIGRGDGDGLLRVCHEQSITMCGAGPMALVLYAAAQKGGMTSHLICHTSSGETSGNYRQTVGYAGIRFAGNA